jgi:hypothetical protein
VGQHPGIIKLKKFKIKKKGWVNITGMVGQHAPESTPNCWHNKSDTLVYKDVVFDFLVGSINDDPISATKVQEHSRHFK